MVYMLDKDKNRKEKTYQQIKTKYAAMFQKHMQRIFIHFNIGVS